MKPSSASPPLEIPASLVELQQSFLRALREQDGGLAETPGLFAGPPRSSTVERWDVYREGYLIRLTEAVKNDFPAVARIVGPQVFRALVGRYFAAHPPHSHDIGRAGERLSEFLSTDPLAAELPFLPDLAHFEAVLSASVVAADSPPFDRAELAAWGDAAFEVPLELAPGAAVLVSAWPLGDLWELRDRPDDEIDLEVVGRPSRILVHRAGSAVVRWREIDADEAAFLTAIETGDATVSSLCDGGLFGPPEEAAPRLVTILLRLLELGAVRFPSSRTPAGVL